MSTTFELALVRQQAVQHKRRQWAARKKYYRAAERRRPSFRADTSVGDTSGRRIDLPAKQAARTLTHVRHRRRLFDGAANIWG
jgi:hypothetical protein